MKKIICILLNLVFTSSFAISQYDASYALYASTDLGSVKVGNADFKLEFNGNNEFTFSSQSYTDSIWKKLYDYTRYEKSIGFLKDNRISGKLYDIVEIEKDEITKNNKILINHNENFAIYNNSSKWETESNLIVDELNVYIALALNLHNNPDQQEFSYHVIDEKGIQLINFFRLGEEIISIEDTDINSIKFSSPELKISINVSKKYDYIPLIIERSSVSTRFRLVLNEYDPT